MSDIKPIMIDYPSTTDYDRFKHLVGNRGVDLQRVAKIKKSIQERYIKSAITINANWEVIDGQGRVAALRELGLPVYYIVDENATLDDCIRMNITSTPWETRDYIYSGRDRGLRDYIDLAILVDRYTVGRHCAGGHDSTVARTQYSVPMDIILAVAKNNVASGTGPTARTSLANGLFKFIADYGEAVKQLDYISSLYKIAPCFGIAAKILLFVKRCPQIDELRMRSQIIKYQKNREIFPAYTTTDECVLSFEALYNYRLNKTNHVDFRALYNQYRIDCGKTAGKAWANGNR